MIKLLYLNVSNFIVIIIISKKVFELAYSKLVCLVKSSLQLSTRTFSLLSSIIFPCFIAKINLQQVTISSILRKTVFQKHCEKRRKCCYPASSCFPTFFLPYQVQMASVVPYYILSTANASVWSCLSITMVECNIILSAYAMSRQLA